MWKNRKLLFVRTTFRATRASGQRAADLLLMALHAAMTLSKPRWSHSASVCPVLLQAPEACVCRSPAEGASICRGAASEGIAALRGHAIATIDLAAL